VDYRIQDFGIIPERMKRTANAQKRRKIKQGYIYLSDNVQPSDVKYMQMTRGVERNPALRYRLSNPNIRTGGYLNMERKFLDASFAGTLTVDNWTSAECDPATLLCLNGIAQGDGESNRDGKNYRMLSVHLRGYVALSQNESVVSPTGDSLIRIALVLDKQTNGAQLSAENVITTGGTVAINGFRDLQYTSRFRVLEDIILRIDNNGLSEGSINLFANGTRRLPFTMNHTFKNPIPVTCSASTGVVGAIVDNSLHVIATALTAGSLDASLAYASRVRFTG
jgi:hypothetical protein